MMARHLAMICLIYCVLSVQPSLVQTTGTVSFRPWLPATALVASVLLVRGAMGLVWAALLGLGVDCLSSEGLGIHMVVATLVAICLTIVRTNRPSPGILVVGTFVFGSAMVWRIGAAGVHSLLDRQLFDLMQQSLDAAVEGICSALIAVVILGVERLLMLIVRSPHAPSMSLTNRWTMLTGG